MQLAHLSVYRLAELVDVQLLLRRDEHAVLAQTCHPCALQLVERDVLLGHRREVVLLLLGPRVVVNLVEHNHRRLVGAS